MSSWRDEVEAAMDSVIDDIATIQAALVVQVTLVLVIDVVKDRIKTAVEDKETITK